MNIIEFIFLLGINFSIFGFIWGIMMLLVRFLSNQNGPKEQKGKMDYVFRIVRYFLLVSVTANLIANAKTLETSGGTRLTYIVLGIVVFSLYLLGKLQNRSALAKLGANPMLARLVPQIDLKVERFIMMGSIVYFAVCLFIPSMVNNGVVNWFRETITGIYNTPVIGWIFSVIAFVFLITTFLRAANVVGRIINGQPVFDSDVTMNTDSKPFNPFEQFTKGNNSNTDDDGFTDYEEIKDDEEKD